MCHNKTKLDDTVKLDRGAYYIISNITKQVKYKYIYMFYEFLLVSKLALPSLLDGTNLGTGKSAKVLVECFYLGVSIGLVFFFGKKCFVTVKQSYIVQSLRPP